MAVVLFHIDRHLRVLQVFGAELCCQITLDLLRRFACYRDFTDKRQIDRAGVRDLHALGELRNLKYGDVEDVQSADSVTGGRRSYSVPSYLDWPHRVLVRRGGRVCHLLRRAQGC